MIPCRDCCSRPLADRGGYACLPACYVATPTLRSLHPTLLSEETGSSQTTPQLNHYAVGTADLPFLISIRHKQFDPECSAGWQRVQSCEICSCEVAHERPVPAELHEAALECALAGELPLHPNLVGYVRPIRLCVLVWEVGVRGGTGLSPASTVYLELELKGVSG